MDPQIRRWLIALIIGIALFAVGMAGHYMMLPCGRTLMQVNSQDSFRSIVFSSKHGRFANVGAHHNNCGAVPSDWRGYAGRCHLSDGWKIQKFG